MPVNFMWPSDQMSACLFGQHSAVFVSTATRMRLGKTCSSRVTTPHHISSGRCLHGAVGLAPEDIRVCHPWAEAEPVFCAFCLRYLNAGLGISCPFMVRKWGAQRCASCFPPRGRVLDCEWRKRLDVWVQLCPLELCGPGQAREINLTQRIRM